MAEQQQQYSLSVLAMILAIFGLLSALVIFALYALAPATLTSNGLSLTTAILGAVGAVYYVTIHQLLARKYLALSTLILTAIT